MEELNQEPSPRALTPDEMKTIDRLGISPDLLPAFLALLESKTAGNAALRLSKAEINSCVNEFAQYL